MWVYAINLVFALLAAVPFATGLGVYLDHSLAAQKIGGTIDFAYIVELALHSTRASALPPWSCIRPGGPVVQPFVLFYLFAGSVFVFVREPPQLSVLLRGGVAYFWRFVRAAILAGGSAAVIVCVLLARRAGLLARLDAVYVERRMFFYSAISGAVVLLVALLLRLLVGSGGSLCCATAMVRCSRVHLALAPGDRCLLDFGVSSVAFLPPGSLAWPL